MICFAQKKQIDSFASYSRLRYIAFIISVFKKCVSVKNVSVLWDFDTIFIRKR